MSCVGARKKTSGPLLPTEYVPPNEGGDNEDDDDGAAGDDGEEGGYKPQRSDLRLSDFMRYIDGPFNDDLRVIMAELVGPIKFGRVHFRACRAFQDYDSCARLLQILESLTSLHDILHAHWEGLLEKTQPRSLAASKQRVNLFAQIFFCYTKYFTQIYATYQHLYIATIAYMERIRREDNEGVHIPLLQLEQKAFAEVRTIPVALPTGGIRNLLKCPLLMIDRYQQLFKDCLGYYKEDNEPVGAAVRYFRNLKELMETSTRDMENKLEIMSLQDRIRQLPIRIVSTPDLYPMVESNPSTVKEVRLEQYGLLVKQGPVAIKRPGETKFHDWHMFLFHRAIIVAKPIKIEGEQHPVFQYKDTIKLDEYDRCDMSNVSMVPGHASFRLFIRADETGGQHWTIRTTRDARNDWINKTQHSMAQLHVSTDKIDEHRYDWVTTVAGYPCDVCEEPLSGLANQAFRCRGCFQVVHEKCHSGGEKCTVNEGEDNLRHFNWFVDDTTKEQAEELLKHPRVPVGTFLVRREQLRQASQYGISIKLHKGYEHHDIGTSLQSEHYLTQGDGSEDKMMSNIVDLVIHFSINPLKVGSTFCLGLPYINPAAAASETPRNN